MALTRWLFLYTAPGLPLEGEVTVVDRGPCRTVLAGFPRPAAAITACREQLAAELGAVQLIELCGGFTAQHVVELRTLAPGVPVGLVTYSSDMVDALQALFAT